MTLVPLVVLAFWIGLYPKPFFRILEEPVQRLVLQLEKADVYPEHVYRMEPRTPLAQSQPSAEADETLSRLATR
jgi:hypothetical protein